MNVTNVPSMAMGVIILIVIVIQVIGATLMKNAAYEKGYGDEVHAFAACFWLGIWGYLYVIALPDKIIQSQNQQLIHYNKMLVAYKQKNLKERMASSHNDKLSKLR